MSAQSFALGDVLSITTDRLVSRDHISGVYRILNFMTGDNLFTHTLSRAAAECKPSLLAQHPQLTEIVVPDDFGTAEAVFAWLAEQEAVYGSMLDIEPLDAADHTVIDPVSELRMMRPGAPVIVFDPSEGGES